MLAKGVKPACPDFARVQPTYAHMALAALVRRGLVKHVVSQNCDGLHVRSSLERAKLSELHGNCFVELCIECDREYVRLFDVTEASAFRKHATSRLCPTCRQPLRDSIIHFGEKFVLITYFFIYIICILKENKTNSTRLNVNKTRYQKEIVFCCLFLKYDI